MKTYRIDYKKVVVAYRKWWIPVYDFRFCIIEINETLSYTFCNYIEEYSQCTFETLLHKFNNEKDALEKLEFLNRYNRS